MTIVQQMADILVVDDTSENLRLLSDMLTIQGFKVRIANSGQRALAAVNALLPDLILLDVMMPDLTGYDVCKQLKANPATSQVPIIFISALDSPEDKLAAFKAGGVDYITKPFQYLEVVARVQTHLNLSVLQKSLAQINEALEKRIVERTFDLLQLNTALKRFVPSEFLGFLNKATISSVRLGDQVQQEMTVMFTDIFGFTGMSERMSPQESFNFLNEYLSRVSPIVRRNRGLIDKFLGDGIMALFPDSVEDAIQASIEIMHEVVKYNKERQRSGLEPIRVGIALHKGSLMLGIIGEEERLQVTVISDAVNLAARMEGLTRDFGAGIVISHATLLEVGRPDAYHTRFLGNVQVKGKQEVVPVYEIYDGDAGQVIARKQETRQDFEAGLRAYLQKDFSNACMYFNAVLEVIPDDKAAQLYRQRSTRFLLSGAPAEWAGYETL